MTLLIFEDLCTGTCITIAFFTNTIHLFVTGWWAIGITVSWVKKIF